MATDRLVNYLLTSHVWRHDHNGFSHQDPGFIDHVVNKKAEVIRVYLPPDTNTLLSVADHCLRSRDYVNVIVAGKQPALTYLSMDDATAHCARGLGIWDWASNDDGSPDVVLAACGDVPTLEALAAVDLLEPDLPDLRIRFVNVVDLMRLQDEDEHPHGPPHRDFDAIFTSDRPIVLRVPRLSVARSIGRRTDARTTAISMCADKEEGTAPRPSTWSCATTSTGITWPST